MNLFNFFKKKDTHDFAEIWNRFIDEICYKELNDLNDIQRKAVIAFWYDAEMGSGGHGGYFDCYKDTDEEELYNILKEIGTEEIANNYKRAINRKIRRHVKIKIRISRSIKIQADNIVAIIGLYGYSYAIINTRISIPCDAWVHSLNPINRHRQ